MPTHPYVSRYFVRSDARCDKLVYELPDSWWSRPFEYEWCTHFTSPHDTVLDVACGIAQPLKFHLAAVSDETFACDIDARIVTTEYILRDLYEQVGPEAAGQISEDILAKLQLSKADLIRLPYTDESFDTIFCIAVLEHLPIQDLAPAVKEFYRTLNSEGLLVLTFASPPVALPLVNEVLLAAGFRYWGETDFSLPADALCPPDGERVYCFRAVLRKVPVSDIR